VMPRDKKTWTQRRVQSFCGGGRMSPPEWPRLLIPIGARDYFEE
jgi:hypothetical protein